MAPVAERLLLCYDTECALSLAAPSYLLHVWPVHELRAVCDIGNHTSHGTAKAFELSGVDPAWLLAVRVWGLKQRMHRAGGVWARL